MNVSDISYAQQAWSSSAARLHPPLSTPPCSRWALREEQTTRPVLCLRHFLCSRTGAPVSAMPGRLRAVVCRGMEQVQAVLVEAQRAQAVAPSRKLNVLGDALSLVAQTHRYLLSCHLSVDSLHAPGPNSLLSMLLLLSLIAIRDHWKDSQCPKCI